MNPTTGKVYVTEDEIRRARERGETLVPVTARAAEIIREGRRARRQGLISARQQRKQRKAARRADTEGE